VIDRVSTARMLRVIRCLEPFQRCFGHRAQRLALRTYVQSLFSDSDRKKSMQVMLARVTQPVTKPRSLARFSAAKWLVNSTSCHVAPPQVSSYDARPKVYEDVMGSRYSLLTSCPTWN
jgi:hypothetical protein